jgi:hypothetical protein
MEFVHKHPKITIAALLAGVAVIGYSVLSGGSSGGSSSAVVGQDPNAIAAGVALQQSQMQQQGQIAGINASLQAQQDNNATQLALADIQGKYSYDVAQLAAGVQLGQINAAAQTTQLSDTLSAQTSQASIKAQTDQAAINGQTQIQTTQAVANALVAQSALNAQTAQAAISANLAAATSCHGIGCWF